MSTGRRVARNSLTLVVRYAATIVTKFLIIVVIARFAGVEQVGDFSFVMTYALTLSFLSHFGMGLLLMREVARHRERVHEYVGNALTLSLGLGLFSVIVMGALVRSLGYSDQIVSAVYLAALAFMLEALANIIIGSFDGIERMELGTLSTIVQEGALLIMGSVILLAGLPFLWIFVILVLSRMANLTATVYLYSRTWNQPPRPRFEPATLRTLARKALPFAVNVALSPIYFRIDILILSYLKGNVAVGYYEVASTLFYRMNVLSRAVNLSIMPLMAREYPLVGRRVVAYVRRAIRYQALVALPITILCWALGSQFITLIYGAEFEPTVLAFQIMASVLFLRFVDHTLGTTLTAIDLHGRRALAMALMAAFNMGLNLLLIPRFSYLGAAIASVATEIGFFILLLVFVRTRLPNPIQPRMLVRPLLASAVMGVPLVLLQGWSLWLLLPLAIIVYVSAALALRVFTPEEMDFLLRLGRFQHWLPKSLWRLVASSTTVSK